MTENRKKAEPDPAFLPEKIFAEAKSLDYSLGQKILAHLQNVPLILIRSPREKRDLREDISAAPDPLRRGKRYLWLTTQKGKFIKPCPCTPGYIGCNYFVINLYLGCPLDCTYCILQSYLADPWISVRVNLEDLWVELDGFFKKRESRYLRLGTGELGDSLALDHITGLSSDLISYFRKWPNADFELKTKTTNIQKILDIDPPQNTVVSWSLNTEKIARDEESGAPSPMARLEAAEKIAARGFRVGFHFDPLIIHPGWKSGYAETISVLLKTIPPSRIAWISLGSFRFPPFLKRIIRLRFPGSRIICGEFIPGRDGKSRYFRPLRTELYRYVAGLIQKNGGERIPLYVCMENARIWEDVMGWKPRGKSALESTLSPRSR